MTTDALTGPHDAIPEHAAPTSNYLTNGQTIKSWLLTLDHKRIALLYLVSISFMFVVGGMAASMVRIELLTPQGDVLTHETYNKMFTLHGVVMVFFFLVPSIPAVLGNFFIPLMIGARDVAFPRLNLLSWYIYTVGAVATLIVALTGGIDTGWTFYTPYSSMFSNTYVAAAAVGVFITGFSSILTGLNFVVTIHKMRAPGLTWFRLPLFIWAHYATSLIILWGRPCSRASLDFSRSSARSTSAYSTRLSVETPSSSSTSSGSTRTRRSTS